MKKRLLLGTALLLSVGQSLGSAPTTPAGAARGYPYNPDKNAAEAADPRTPYYGEWKWTITFRNGTAASGRMSISKRVTPKQGYANASIGAAVYCPDGDACPFESDTALIGSTSNNGAAELIVEMDDPAPDRFIRFVGVDLDGVVGKDKAGRPTLQGSGNWNYDSTHDAFVDFTLTQISTVPPVKVRP